MIQYSLICENEHKFDAWFANANTYENQQKIGIVSCPICASGDVKKALMAPAILASSKPPVSSNSKEEKLTVSIGHPQQKELQAAIKLLREKVTNEADYVGDNFAIEARKIHDKETKPRGIYGEATKEEVSSLTRDGIDFLPLPILPEEHN